MNMPTDELELSVHTANVLDSACISFVGELAGMTIEHALKIRSLGRKGVRELVDELAKVGIGFGMDVGDWSPSPASSMSADRPALKVLASCRCGWKGLAPRRLDSDAVATVRAKLGLGALALCPSACGEALAPVTVREDVAEALRQEVSRALALDVRTAYVSRTSRVIGVSARDGDRTARYWFRWSDVESRPDLIEEMIADCVRRMRDTLTTQDQG